MNSTLLRKEWKSNYKLLLLFLAVLTLYSSVIIIMFDPKLGESLAIMSESMPEIFSAFGMSNMGSTLLEFISNYLYGFLFLAFPLIFIVLLANRLIVKYVDHGSMAYLLSTPNKRSTIAITQASMLLLSSLCLVVYVTLLCIGISEALFPGKLNISGLLWLNTGWLGLLVFFCGICFFSSCCFNDTKMANGTGAGLCILFLLIQMLSQVNDKLDVLKYFTPLTLFAPSRLIQADGTSIFQFLFLYMIGFLLFGIGIFQFSRRDLPI